MSDIKKTNQPIVSQRDNSVKPKKTLAKRTDKPKKIGWITRLVSRKVNKLANSAITGQLSSIAKEIQVLSKEIATTPKESPKYKELCHQFEVLVAKKDLIVEVDGLNTDIQEVLGEDRNLGIIYAAKLLGDGKLIGSAETIVYKVIANKPLLTRILAKVVFAIAKFIVRVAVSGAKKENYQLKPEELKKIQDAVAGRLNKLSDIGVDKGIGLVIDNIKGINEEQKTILKDVIKTSVSELNQVFGDKENPKNIALVAVANILKTINFVDIKSIIKSRLPGIVDVALGSDMVKSKIGDALKDAPSIVHKLLGVKKEEDITSLFGDLKGEDILPLVENAYDFATGLVDDLIVENPNYDVGDIKEAATQFQTVFESVRETLGTNIINFLKAADKKDSVGGILKQRLLKAGIKFGTKIEKPVIDLVFNTISRTLFKICDGKVNEKGEIIINREKLAGFVKATLIKQIPLLLGDTEGKVTDNFNSKMIEIAFEKIVTVETTGVKEEFFELHFQLKDLEKKIEILNTSKPKTNEPELLKLNEQKSELKVQLVELIETHLGDDDKIQMNRFLANMIKAALGDTQKDGKSLLKTEDLVKMGMNIYSIVDAILVDGIMNTDQYNPTNHETMDGLPMSIGDNLAKIFLGAMVESKGDLFTFPAYLKKHKGKLIAQTAFQAPVKKAQVGIAKIVNKAVEKAEVVVEKTEVFIEEAKEKLEVKLDSVDTLLKEIAKGHRGMNKELQSYIYGLALVHQHDIMINQLGQEILALKLKAKKHKYFSAAAKEIRVKIDEKENILSQVKSSRRKADKKVINSIEFKTRIGMKFYKKNTPKQNELVEKYDAATELFKEIRKEEKIILKGENKIERKNARIAKLRERANKLMS